MDEETAGQVDAGMEAQLQRLRAERQQGLERIGWKVAINQPSIQATFGLDGWLVGALPATGALTEGSFTATPDHQLHLEAEFAVRLGTSLPPRAAPEEAIESIEYFAPAIELVDYALPRASLAEITAHSFFHAACWIGTGGTTWNPIGSECPVIRRNDEIVATSDARQSAFDPTPIVLGVAELLERYEERLEGGDWILCGSLTEPVSAEAGDRFAVDYGSLGKLEMQIENPARS